ncbi:MAG TPA: hypothetical protein RMH99_29275 [Sandaracinaceae bacterium LLY-WYZ-13_1]|nr:hypothetical protein [Sandaracinaceae bacterium LLY-WYZ-13_1]
MRAASIAAVLSLLAAPAAAQEAPEAADTSGGEDAPTPGADEYTQRVQEGIQRLVSGDASGARESFEAAEGLDGERPQAVYYLGAAHRLAGELEPALARFQRATELAQAADEARWQARAMQGTAETLERMENRIEDARSAWQAYIRFADAHQTVAHPQLARARVQAIDMMNEQERVYVEVRERIAEREREQAEEEDED